LAVEERRGIDWQVDYVFNLGGLGINGDSTTRARIRNIGNYSFRNRYQPLEGSDFINCNGIFGTGCTGLGDFISPRWKTNTQLTLSSGGFTWLNQVRVTGPVRNQDVGDFITRVPTSAYWDMALSWDVGDHFSFTLGVDNVLDKDVVVLADSGPDANTDASLYDVFGRTFFVSGRVRF
jgi:outer membrane receptor protein involved in Fe transport